MTRHTQLTTILGLTLAALASLNASAQERCTTCGNQPASDSRSVKVAPPGSKTLFNNIGTGSDRFNTSAGWTVAGPASGVAPQSIALPFTPTTGATLGGIEVGASYLNGANNMLVTINEDNNGLPGDPIGSMVVSNLPPYGWPYVSCFWGPLPRPFFPWPCYCIVIVIVDWPPPIIFTEGKQYWLTVSANTSDPNFQGVWNYNVAGTTGTLAINNGSGWQLTNGVLPAAGILGN
jgi:hypothetical protein